MFLLYVDESGNVGITNSPTRYFALSGLVVHELRWLEILDRVVDFRRQLRASYGLKLREEIHASNFIHKPGDLARVPKSLRLRLLRDVVDFEATLPDINIINIIIDKQGRQAGFDFFEMAWRLLFQRFHNTLAYRNFPGPQNPQDLGVLVVDQTAEVPLRRLLRRMRRFNPVPGMQGLPGRQIPVTTLVEDPNHRDSLHSYFIQLADVNAYFLYQKHRASSYVKRKGARNYFDRLDPVLCKVAARNDPQGVVRL